MCPDPGRLVFLFVPTATGPMARSESGVVLHLMKWSSELAKSGSEWERCPYQVPVGVEFPPEMQLLWDFVSEILPK